MTSESDQNLGIEMNPKTGDCCVIKSHITSSQRKPTTSSQSYITDNTM